MEPCPKNYNTKNSCEMGIFDAANHILVCSREVLFASRNTSSKFKRSQMAEDFRMSNSRLYSKPSFFPGNSAGDLSVMVSLRDPWNGEFLTSNYGIKRSGIHELNQVVDDVCSPRLEWFQGWVIQKCHLLLLSNLWKKLSETRMFQKIYPPWNWQVSTEKMMLGKLLPLWEGLVSGVKLLVFGMEKNIASKESGDVYPPNKLT